MNEIQNIIVTLIFFLCLYFVARRIGRFISSARKKDSRCEFCSETSCPLRDATRAKKCGCDCH